MRVDLNNPIIPGQLITLEKIEAKENKRFNTLLKMKLKSIKKNFNPNVIICTHGRIFLLK